MSRSFIEQRRIEDQGPQPARRPSPQDKLRALCVDDAAPRELRERAYASLRPHISTAEARNLNKAITGQTVRTAPTKPHKRPPKESDDSKSA